MIITYIRFLEVIIPRRSTSLKFNIKKWLFDTATDTTSYMFQRML